MSILDYLMQIDWTNEKNRVIADTVYADSCEYWKRVIDHIYKGNEIRADQWMDYSEKQDEIRRLDKKRTEAHNKLLISAADLLDLLSKETDFIRSNYKLENRTQVADFIASIAFELVKMDPSSRVEGNVRDELAEKIHIGVINTDMLSKAMSNIVSARRKCSD